MFAMVVLAWGVLVWGSIWLLVKAFQQSLLWGLAALFVPFASIVFVVMHWDDAKKPFLMQLGGLAVFVLIAMLGGGHAVTNGVAPG